MQFVAWFACTVAPILFWFLWIRRKDGASPEPRHLLLRCYLLGALGTGLVLLARPALEALMLDRADGYSAWRDAFLVTAPLEEIVKMLVIVIAVLHHDELDEPLDGIVYGACVALGFATVENVLYVMQDGDPRLATLRGFTATLAHVAASGIVGLCLALAKLGARPTRVFVAVLGLLVAVALHGAYDLGLSLADRPARAALVIVLPTCFVALGIALRWAQRSGLPAHHAHM